MVEVRAHTNIAIVKYWGKHPKWEEYHVPTKSSLSFTVKDLYTTTEVHVTDGTGRLKGFELDGKPVNPDSKEWKKVEKYVQKLGKLVSPDFLKYDYTIRTSNNFPTAAGFASSASGFAALAKAILLTLSEEHTWMEDILNDVKKLSVVARLGSGSACRSVTNGAVLWRRGWDREPFDPLWDSHAEEVTSAPEDILLVYVTVNPLKKKVSSREGMARSVRTSPIYWTWVEMEEDDLETDLRLVRKRRWEELFPRIMMHSNALHAVCRYTYPPIEYLTDQSREIIERVHTFIEEHGNVVAYTFDAGPNPVLFVLEDVWDDARKIVDGFKYTVTRPL